jgi:hypothetical protein
MKSILVRDFADSQRSFVSVLFGARLTDFVTRINCMSPLGKSRAATTLPGLNWIVIRCVARTHQAEAEAEAEP